MEPTRELVDELFRERVLRARRTPPEQKILAGPRLFEWACEIAKAGIRQQFPDADEAEVRRLLDRRLAIQERLEEVR